MWLRHYRLLSSHHYRIWAPSSSALNTTTNICHVLFAFATSPLGKMHVQWHAQFWSAFSVWDWFDFFKKDAYFWISVRKGKMEETHIALRAACRNIHRGLCMGMVLFSFLRLIWRNCWPYQDFLWERSRAGLPWKPRTGVLIARWQQVKLQLTWSAATSEGLPLGTEQRALAMAENEQEGYFYKLLCESFGLGFTLTCRRLLSKGRFFWLRGGKRDTILGLLALVQEGVDFSFEGA